MLQAIDRGGPCSQLDVISLLTDGQLDLGADTRLSLAARAARAQFGEIEVGGADDVGKHRALRTWH